MFFDSPSTQAVPLTVHKNSFQNSRAYLGLGPSQLMEVLEEYPYNESFLKNGLSGLNITNGGRRHQYNYYAMLLTLLIFVIVFGNVLVCMAVSREKALQTTTNYLIVSLAVADLLVATLVMPWVVYLEVVGEWRFSTIHCDVFVTLDVMMCTASILNLCAISIDRYTAVAMPMLYNTRYSSKRRVTVMISVVWILSFAISCPLLFGLNNTDSHDEALCVIANPAFVVYSSVVSFYVPFIITLLVYVQIYVVLRRRRKRVSTKRTYPSSNTDVGVFIICWLPFFITHIVNTYCHVPVELYTAFTWLGYVNSAVNPIIYTTFNIEFRKAFIKILHC
ncbi:D(2)-like dopamine receptor [Bagarius yarrelli]|uniref:D(2)-like dopamine receptor n=1 Tax=Bagarius yarrelli TaxID=175774 RepID=A0A556V077_BAGYA|nr:D(2)-like dopamine receptor [Bagarius yarrelli]